jgi:hypothetical protein
MRYIPLRTFENVIPGYRTQQFLDEFCWTAAEWSQPEFRPTFARLADTIADCKDEWIGVSDEDHEKIARVIAPLDFRKAGVTNTSLFRPLRTVLNSILDASSKKPAAKPKPKQAEEAPEEEKEG